MSPVCVPVRTAALSVAVLIQFFRRNVASIPATWRLFFSALYRDSASGPTQQCQKTNCPGRPSQLHRIHINNQLSTVMNCAFIKWPSSFTLDFFSVLNHVRVSSHWLPHNNLAYNFLENCESKTMACNSWIDFSLQLYIVAIVVWLFHFASEYICFERQIINMS